MADDERVERHPLEVRLNASADDIMSAVMGGFRAIIDVKGKLAEYFLAKQLNELQARGAIESFEWRDTDGQPDFEVRFRGTSLLVEAKNVRSPKATRRQRAEEAALARVELQKTRNGVTRDGRRTRGYRLEEFDCLAVCLFNQTGEWTYLYTTVSDLAVRDDDPEILQVFHSVPLTVSGNWKGDLVEVLETAAERKRRTP